MIECIQGDVKVENLEKTSQQLHAASDNWQAKR